MSLAVVWLKLGGCLAAGWLSSLVAGGWVAVHGWWLVAAQGRGGTPWWYGSARETPEYCDFKEVSFL